jgi:uncharacterized protein YkwD
VRKVTSAPAAAPVRLALAAAFLAIALASVLASRADAAPAAWNTYLAPSGACPGATDRASSAAAQGRAIRCLVNWARAQAKQHGLNPSRELHRAAVLKGRGVASCGQLSHAPCNSGVTDAVRVAGYPFAAFGENLFVGMRHASAQDVVAAWLASPGHRANMLSAGFREVGLAGVRTRGLIGDVDSVVWVAAFGARR